MRANEGVTGHRTGSPFGLYSGHPVGDSEGAAGDRGVQRHAYQPVIRRCRPARAGGPPAATARRLRRLQLLGIRRLRRHHPGGRRAAAGRPGDGSLPRADPRPARRRRAATGHLVPALRPGARTGAYRDGDGAGAVAVPPAAPGGRHRRRAGRRRLGDDVAARHRRPVWAAQPGLHALRDRGITARAGAPGRSPLRVVALPGGVQSRSLRAVHARRLARR